MTKIINLRSRKGGVGKTTLALAIGAELLNNGPVVLIDADILGTEVADLVRRPDSNDLWDLGLLDLLTASIGANRSFNDWLRDRLGKEPLELLPRLAVGDDGSKGLVVIPSHRSLCPAERDRATAGIGHQMLVLDFAQEQVARRFFSLLSCLLNWKPAAIVIDNSPLHAGLARLTSKLPKSPPIGLNGVHDTFFKENSWFNIEVVGPDRPDLLPFFADYEAENSQIDERPITNFQGWIINRDLHYKSGEIPGGCALLAEAEGDLQTRLLADPAVLHVEFNQMVSMSTNARYGDPEERTSRPRTAPLGYAEAIRLGLKTLKLTCGDPNDSLPTTRWLEWLDLLEGPKSP